MKIDVAVVGGGPAGLSAALFAKAKGLKMLLLEHNEKLGKKLYITGKGRCNLSNLCDIQDFLSHVPRNPRFLYAALTFLPPAKLLDWFDQLCLYTVVERGRRVFPASQKASDVTKALSKSLCPDEVRLNTKVKSLLIEHNVCKGVLLESGEAIHASSVILATGGLSYPVTGSTGDGHKMAMNAGHAITPLSPSLTGIDTDDAWCKQIQGLSLKNISLVATWPKKGKFSEQGELLFTHYGISGPLALSLSSYLSGLPLEGVSLSIDLKPALTQEVLRERLKRDIQENGRKLLSSLLPQYMPHSLAEVFPEISAVPGSIPLNQLSKAQQEALLTRLKHLPLAPVSLRSFQEAVITRGGVDIKQINPSTMQSRLVNGLFFAGELLDVDALTGGYNLQIAFSTGALAGTSAATYCNTQINSELE